MIQIPSAPEIAVIGGDFGGFTANRLYDHFVRPDLVVLWWPRVAEMDVRVGGGYHFSWAENDWHLRGEFTALDPGRHFGFTWQWDHDPEIGPKQVDVHFLDLDEESARLAIYHGPFDASERSQGDRQGIIEGWIHFGMLLAGLRVGEAL